MVGSSYVPGSHSLQSYTNLLAVITDIMEQIYLFLSPIMPPVQSRVCKYKPDEINLADLASHGKTLRFEAVYVFQLEIAAAVFHGEDVIADIGTGSGKTLCFSLPLLFY